MLRHTDHRQSISRNFSLKNHTNGITQRSHGYSYCKPAHALKFIEIENTVKFLRNYTDEFGIPQPADFSGSDGIPPICLPASDTKRLIHDKYYELCAELI